MKWHELIWWLGTLLGAGAAMAAFAWGFQNGIVGFFGFALVWMIALGVRDAVETSHRENVHQEGMRQAATRLGFSFRETAPFNVLGWSESFHLTRDRMETQQAVEKMYSSKWASSLTPYASNVMERSMEDAAVAVFEYKGRTKAKPSHVAKGHTVFAVRSSKITFPHFALIPSGWCDRLVDQFRGNVDPQDRYRAISEDPGGPERFDERLFPLLDGDRFLEAGEGFLLLYRRDRLVAPEHVDELIRTGMEIYSVLSGPTSDIRSPALST